MGDQLHETTDLRGLAATQIQARNEREQSETQSSQQQNQSVSLLSRVPNVGRP
jgi:hypothetical protein